MIDNVAYRMVVRNVGDYGDPAMIEFGWADQQIRGFWVEQAEAVARDLARTAGASETDRWDDL